MDVLLGVLALLLGIAVAAFLRLPLTASTALLALVPAGASLAQDSILTAVVLWAIFLSCAVPLNVTALRRRWFSAPLLQSFRRAMPEMSSTEREALEAGTVGWDGELFGGRPDWRRFLSLPAARLSAEEQAFLDGPVEELCRMLDDWDITERRHDLPPEVWGFLKTRGFFGIIIPRDYGGLGFSALAHSGVVMKIATRSISAAVTVMVPNSLGPAELLLHYGTQEQKDYYLPRLARGEEVPCFALTGPEAGSDASAIPDTGVVCRGVYQGREIVGIRLNWDKRYITLGPVSTVLGLAFKLYDPEHLCGDRESIGITLALIPTGTPGVDIGNRHAPLNIAFQNGPNRGRDVFIPLDWVIGGRSGFGQGWRMLMESLAAGRSISLPALSTGAGKLASRATGAYARIRRQFKQPIGRFEGVAEVLARIAANTYLMDAARVVTAAAIDRGEKPAVISAIVKYQLTERMRHVVNDAMDVQGGSGICMGPRNLLGRVYQAVPISITVEGANILTRSLIIFGQGAIRCHPFVLREMRAAADADATRALREFDRAVFGHAGFMLGNAVRALWLGLTGARLIIAPGAPQTQRYYRQAARMSAALALVSDAAMLALGGELKRRESLSGRLADVFGHLYLVSCMLKHHEEQGRPPEDLPLLRWACEDALYEMQCRLDGLLRNFPVRALARVLRLLVFPLGRCYGGPDDRMGQAAAAVILSPGATRDRLTAGAFIPREAGEAIGRIEAALEAAVAAEAVEKKLRTAVRAGRIGNGGEEAMLREGLLRGVVDEDEAGRYRNAVAARREVVAVDEFPQGYWGSDRS
ncbi:MAG: acyl-CoA dehydrogenase [Gammaproteobacteria bacterium]